MLNGVVIGPPAGCDPAGKAERPAGLVPGKAPRITCLDCPYPGETPRGRGPGRALLARVARSAQAAGCIRVQWHTTAFDHGALRFYARAGAAARTKIRFFSKARLFAAWRRRQGE